METPVEWEQRRLALGPEPAQCLVCAAPAPRRLFFRSEKWFWICARCELVFVHDIYPEFATDVEHLDGTYDYRSTRPPNRRERVEYRRLLAEFADLRRTNRLLEVGCNQGIFLEVARAAGWEVDGVEILAPVAELARRLRGLDVHVGELADARFDGGRFDVVYMNEVIEHVVDPVGLLTEVCRVLRPGGMAVLRTGNARSWSARLRGGGWSYYRFGGHMHIRYYGPKSAAALAAVTGFASVKTRTRGFAFREGGELKGRGYAVPVRLAQALISPLAGPFGRGHRLTMMFSKGA
jgi:SAM-dependent methyltransferase